MIRGVYPSENNSKYSEPSGDVLFNQWNIYTEMSIEFLQMNKKLFWQQQIYQNCDIFKHIINGVFFLFLIVYMMTIKYWVNGIE